MLLESISQQNEYEVKIFHVCKVSQSLQSYMLHCIHCYYVFFSLYLIFLTSHVKGLCSVVFECFVFPLSLYVIIKPSVRVTEFSRKRSLLQRRCICYYSISSFSVHFLAPIKVVLKFFVDILILMDILFHH